MKKALIFLALAVVLVGVPLIGKLTQRDEATEVRLHTVEVKPLRSSILASGTLTFKEQVQLRSEVIGQVIDLHVKESDLVSKGDMVVTLEPKTYQAQVDQAAALVRIQAIAIERQELLIENLQERFDRQSSLFKAKLVDEDSFELLENQLALARVDLRSQQESLSQAQAALNQALELLEKTRIRSPIDGVVIQIDVKVGETVIAGTTNIPGSTLMIIADPSETLSEVQVDEADIASVHIGQSADVFAAAYSEQPLSGQVQQIAAVARQSTGQRSLSFLVKILLDEQDELEIRPGMSVRADIYTQASDSSLVVPIGAVRYEESEEDDAPEQAFVFIANDGVVERRAVKVGLSSDSEQEILEGVKEGEQLVSGPYRAFRELQDGDAVEEIEDTDSGGVVISASVD